MVKDWLGSSRLTSENLRVAPGPLLPASPTGLIQERQDVLNQIRMLDIKIDHFVHILGACETKDNDFKIGAAPVPDEAIDILLSFKDRDMDRLVSSLLEKPVADGIRSIMLTAIKGSHNLSSAAKMRLTRSIVLGKYEPSPSRDKGIMVGSGTKNDVRASFITTEHLDRHVAACTDFVKALRAPLIMMRPNESAFHKLKDAFTETKVIIPSQLMTVPLPTIDVTRHEYQVFVVEHDWAQAFKTARDFDGGEFLPPAQLSCFEFRVNNRRVCALLADFRDGNVSEGIEYTDVDGFLSLMMFVEAKDVGWAYFGTASGRSIDDMKAVDRPGESEVSYESIVLGFIQPMTDLVCAQIKAISVALEAEIAVTDVVRASYKLNRSREKRGRALLVDYHVVVLSRRQRAAALPDDHVPGTHASPRFHFRRSHWRHYQNHKVRIPWTLVGNPDLGVIMKEYRL